MVLIDRKRFTEEEVKEFKWTTLPEDIKKQAEAEYDRLCRDTDNSYSVHKHIGRLGTDKNARAFIARRVNIPSTWNGHFGGGSYWLVTYCTISWSIKKMVEMGETFWCIDIFHGKVFTSKRMEDGSIYNIPREVNKKSELKPIMEKLGF